MTLASGAGLRQLQEDPTTGAPTGTPTGTPTGNPPDGDLALAQVFMLVDNLSFMQPFDGLCLAVSSLNLEPQGEGDDDNDMDVEGIMWINGRPATEGLQTLAETGDCETLLSEMKERTPGIMIPKNVTITPMPEDGMITDKAMVNFTVPIKLTDSGRPPLL